MQRRDPRSSTSTSTSTGRLDFVPRLASPTATRRGLAARVQTSSRRAPVVVRTLTGIHPGVGVSTRTREPLGVGSPSHRWETSSGTRPVTQIRPV